MTGPARSDYCPIANASVIPSRPDIDSLVEAAVEDVLTDLASKTYECVRGGGVAVGTCGPDQLVRAVRKAVSGVTRARAVKACVVPFLSFQSEGERKGSDAGLLPLHSLPVAESSHTLSVSAGRDTPPAAPLKNMLEGCALDSIRFSCL